MVRLMSVIKKIIFIYIRYTYLHITYIYLLYVYIYITFVFATPAQCFAAPNCVRFALNFKIILDSPMSF